MIVYPRDKTDEVRDILLRYPYSRIITQQYRYKDEILVSVRSDDLQLLKEIQNAFPTWNNDPTIRSL